VAGIDWGLPSKQNDQFLFASHRIWSGEELAEFDRGRSDSSLGADVDRDPLDRSAGGVVINDLNEKRAEILRRYRLYSAQPDEMITFMSLQQMSPGDWDFDPRLYQYGGLWVYPVGAMLKASSMVGLIELRNDTAFYYDNPEQFGRFYVVARLYTLAWYAVLLIATAAVAKRLTGDDFASIAAAGLVGVCPVVFAMAHEAKPHLPGCALMMLAAWAAMVYADRGRLREAALAGVLCGLASGMVVSAAVIGVVLPVMVLVRRDSWGKRVGMLLLAVALCGIAYAATNPYVPINLLRGASVLESNADNTAEMYRIGTAAAVVRDGFSRLLDAASLPVLILFGCAVLAFVSRRKRPSPGALLLIVPALLVIAPFLAFSAGKPAEYARFSMFAVVTIAVGGIWVLSLIPRASIRGSLMAIVPVVVVVVATMPYFTAFDLDARDEGTRQLAAQTLHAMRGRSSTLMTPAEPGPYVMPPVDLWDWRIVVTDDLKPRPGEVSLRAIDTPAQASTYAGVRRTIIDAGQRPAPITWANKPFELLEPLTQE
jgi:hypothetical protein